MPAAKVNLYIEQGATFKRRLTLSDGAGNPLDLTGCKLRMMGRESYDTASTQFEVSTDTSGIVVTLPNTVDITFSDEVTAAMTAPKGVYDLELEWSTGETDRLMQGAYTLSLEVTR